MSLDPSSEIAYNPYPVTLTAGFDGNNSPYFLYSDQNGQINSPLIIPAAQPPYDGIRFTQTGSTRVLRLWAAATQTINGGSLPPQGDNLLPAPNYSVTIRVNPGTKRGTVLIFEQLDANGAVINLVATPDPRTQNNG